MEISKKSKVSIKNILYTAGMVLLAAAVMSYLYSSYLVKKEQQYLPTVFGLTGVTIQTGSMAPNAEVGDYVVIKLPKVDEIQEGDIITFKDNNILVTHRVETIVEENGRKAFSTKGDANNTTDENLVYLDNIVGVSVLVVPKLGLVFNWITSTKGMIILGAIILILFFLPDKKKNKTHRDALESAN